jgi:CubicO group peptidase (beta-lactamase class C family)
MAKSSRPKGYGVRKLGDPGRVDERTTFGIASNTKAFTAAALGILVDEGKLKWDDPVQKHLPGFSLHDPLVTRDSTVRDLLCHRTGLGLGAGDLLFWPDTDVTRAEVVSAARFIRPAATFRSKYQYNNLTFVVAGEVIAAVSGKSYDDFVREKIMAPLGMAEAHIGFAPGPNVAIPHSRGWRLEGTLTPITPTKDQTWAAAAGVKASVTDLLKWLNGHLTGKRPWSDGVQKEMWQAQTALQVSEPPAALKSTKPNFAAYGFGWSLRDYKGRKIVTHGGALTGMVSITYMIPDEGLGIAVLTNQEESGAMSSIVQHIVDHYLGLPPQDWIAAYQTVRADQLKRANAAEVKLEAERAKDGPPSLPLSQYAGQYADAWYGKAALADESGRLVLRFSRTPAMVADLSHWHHNTFRAVFRDKTVPDAFVTFSLDHRGRVDGITMEAVSTLADFSFDYQDLHFRPVRP